MENENISFNSTVARLFYEMKYYKIKEWLWNQNKTVEIKNFSVYMERANALYILNEYKDAFELLNNISKLPEMEDEFVYLCEFNKFQLLQVLCGDSDKMEFFNQIYKLTRDELDIIKSYLNKNTIHDYYYGYTLDSSKLEDRRKKGFILSWDLIIKLKSSMKRYWNSNNNNFLMTCEYELDKKEYHRYFNNLFSYYAELNYCNENPIITGRNLTEFSSNETNNICMSVINLEYFDLFILLNYFKIDEVIALFNKYKVKSVSFSEDVSISCVFSNITDFPSNAKKNNMFKLFFYIISKFRIEEEEMYYFERAITESIILHSIRSKNEFDSIAYFYSHQYMDKSYLDVFFVIKSLEFLLIEILLDFNIAEDIEDYIKEVSLIVAINCESYYLDESTIKSIICSINSSGNISARILTLIYKLCNKKTQEFIEIKIKELLYDNNTFFKEDFFLCYYSLMNCCN